MLTAHYIELSHISQRIVSKDLNWNEVFSLSKSLMLEVEAKIDAFIIFKEERRRNANMSIIVDTYHNSVPNLNEVTPLQDPTKRRSKGQSSKIIKGPLETKSRKKNTLKAKV